MRKIKTIKIYEKEITIKELRVKDIRKMIAMSETPGDDILGDVGKLLPLTVDISPQELEELAPSEIKMLWEGFKEVNADFLAVIERLGIARTFESLIKKHLTEAFADLSSTGISEHGNTGGASL